MFFYFCYHRIEQGNKDNASISEARAKLCNSQLLTRQSMVVAIGFHYQHGLMKILLKLSGTSSRPRLQSGVGGLSALFCLDHRGRLPYKFQNPLCSQTLLHCPKRPSPAQRAILENKYPAYSGMFSLIHDTQPYIQIRCKRWFYEQGSTVVVVSAFLVASAQLKCPMSLSTYSD